MLIKPVRKPLRQPTVTFEEVARACEKIAESGDRPTIPGIHQIVGRGRFTEIKQHLGEWNQGRKLRASECH